MKNKKFKPNTKCMNEKHVFFTGITLFQRKNQVLTFNLLLRSYTHLISSSSLIYINNEVSLSGERNFSRIGTLEIVNRTNLFRTFGNRFKMMSFKLCLTICLISFSNLVNAQTPLNQSDIEEMLVGTWHVTQPLTEKENDLNLKPEEVIYMIFEDNNANLRFSSFINNYFYDGPYRISYDRKSKDFKIIFKKAYGNCETKSVKIVSLTDSSLVIQSCINSVDIVFEKSPAPSERIRNVKNILIGSWEYSKTIMSESQLPVLPFDNLVSCEFSEDSVILYLKKDNQTIVRKSNYIIYCDNLELTHYSIYTPNFTRESCDTFSLFYILSIDRNIMISERCDNDHYKVIYERK
ncbi:hypothetical protein [Fluviicola taffensis]|nr:hypothetical protein [Fluviicola taffensis]